jgi:hypothetical protein
VLDEGTIRIFESRTHNSNYFINKCFFCCDLAFFPAFFVLLNFHLLMCSIWFSLNHPKLRPGSTRFGLNNLFFAIYERFKLCETDQPTRVQMRVSGSIWVRKIVLMLSKKMFSDSGQKLGST